MQETGRAGFEVQETGRAGIEGKDFRVIILSQIVFHSWKDGKNILPSKERHDNFQLQGFQCAML